MKTRRIPKIARPRPVVFLILALLLWICVAGADVALDQQLIRAVTTRDVALVNTLLEKGANVNAKDKEGTPALMLAAWLQNRDVVRLLLEKGADVHAKDRQDRTALELADWAGHYEIVEILGGKRADRDMTGYPHTPEGVVEAYVKAGFDVASVRQLFGSYEVKEQMRYVLDYFCPGWDCVHIVSGYKVTKTSEDQHVATVKVVYDGIGGVCGQFVSMGEKTERPVMYDLEKHEGFWKIRAPLEGPRISVKSAIELLKYSMTDEDELNKYITSLRDYLGK